MKTTIKDVHKIDLLLLDEFIRVCDKYNLQWFADSGTLLGAIRHSEIIPWDDDIDVIMPRKDYNKLLKIAKKEFKAPFFFQSPETDNYWRVTCKLRYNNSTFFENDNRQIECMYDNNHGIFIDIFVYDNVPEDDDVFTSEEYFLRFIYNYTSAYLFGHKEKKPTFNCKELFKTINIMLTDISEANENSNYVANMFFNKCHRYMHFKISKDAYSSYTEMDFKGLQHKLRIPKGWEEILELWYGKDWRTPKKIEASHGEGTSFYDVEHSYDYYKDISLEDFIDLIHLK